MPMTATVTLGATQSPAEDWRYAVKIYGLLPSVSGNLKYGPSGESAEIDVDADEILDALQMTFMGSFEARKGTWSGFTDVIYLELAGDKSKSVTIPDGATRTLLDADVDLKGWVWTLGGSYTLWRNQESHLDLLVGARLLSLDTDLKLTGGGSLQRYRKLSDSVDLWDGILGAKGRVALNDRWFLPYYADVGTGDTDLAWQAAAGVGCAFNWATPVGCAAICRMIRAVTSSCRTSHSAAACWERRSGFDARLSGAPPVCLDRKISVCPARLPERNRHSSNPTTRGEENDDAT